MDFIGDFHIHSHFSIATSKLLTPEHLEAWARLKGISAVGTGDISHPGWLAELEEKLQAEETGLLTLKEDYRLEDSGSQGEEQPRFLLTGEISSIYKKNGKVRKVHNLVFLPDFESAHTFQSELTKIGNITSDGRPILGLDSKVLLDIVLHVSDRAFFVPAHIWTPWFSALEAKSGFDTIDECFEDLTPHIHAVETGLSSDPPMNWLCSFLDPFTIISNSDAHSPEKLGREANLFSTDLTYDSIIGALRMGEKGGFRGTIEFFPQEGKYHFDGHRKCGCRMDPLASLKAGDICPVCGRKMTIGVMNRVAQLADRDSPAQRPDRLPFHSLIPLKEILGEIAGTGPGSKKVAREYSSLISKCGSEITLLLTMPLDEIGSACGEVLREAVRRMREREVYIEEGYDGEFGTITVFAPEETVSFDRTAALFPETPGGETAPPPPRPFIPFDIKEYRTQASNTEPKLPETSSPASFGLNSRQQEAVDHEPGPLAVIAGPGSGKTGILAFRALSLMLNRGIDPENMLLVTFTNKAARELADRITGFLTRSGLPVVLPRIATFHAFGLSILKENIQRTGRSDNFLVINEEEKEYIEKNLPLNITYSRFLEDHSLFDFDQLISEPLRLLEENQDILENLQNRYSHIMVDEFQDINSLQYRLLRLLKPGKSDNICIIGDPNQSIYSFRGGDPALFNEFSRDYPGARHISLDTSYRCPSILLEAASQIISAPSALKGLTRGLSINITEHPTDRSEAEFIARTIEDMMGGLRFFSMDSSVSEGEGMEEITSLADFAVLCRTFQQMDALSKAFRDHSIPFQTVGRQPFYQREPARTIISLLQLSINKENRFLLEMEKKNRLITGDAAKLLENLEQHPSAAARIKAAAAGLRFEEGEEAAVKHCQEAAHPYGDNIREFLNHILLGTVQDDYDSAAENVALMTLHAAKGLEWRCVFIPGCEEGLLPLSLFENQKGDPREERRLFYVGLTRSKKYLYLSSAGRRTLFHQTFTLPKSPFLSDIEESLKSVIQVDYSGRNGDESSQLELF